MQGPMPARIRSGRAPSRVIAATVASMIPASAPRQPPCAAPMIRASGSANSTGAQSAARTPSAIPGAAVTIAVGAGVFLARPGALDCDRGRAVDLMAADQTIGRKVEPGGCDRAVLPHRFRRVARAETAIQGREHAATDPAMAGEKGMPYSGIGSGKLGKRREG